jgi:dTDP-glucose 4,6-dehydratase
LVTGGAGFIGSNFIRRVLATEPSAQVTNLDAMTYAGVQATIDELDSHPNHRFVKGDIRDVNLVESVIPGHDIVVHFAAESHVDRSIAEPQRFLETNVVGTGVLLAAAERAEVSRFIHISTDEVYGSLESGSASEDSSLDPSSPYAASKAGSDLLALSYWTTRGFPVIVTRCTNNFGPYQFPEKLIPLSIAALLDSGSIPLYGDGLNVRDWIHVDDHNAAIQVLTEEGEPGSVYNIGTEIGTANTVVAKLILDAMGLDETRIESVADRPGHDRRYAVNTTKIRGLGWEPQRLLADEIPAVIDWYRERRDWWEPLKERL